MIVESSAQPCLDPVSSSPSTLSALPTSFRAWASATASSTSISPFALIEINHPDPVCAEGVRQMIAEYLRHRKIREAQEDQGEAGDFALK